jgi:DNA polymerase III delta prime subunit
MRENLTSGLTRGAGASLPLLYHSACGGQTPRQCTAHSSSGCYMVADIFGKSDLNNLLSQYRDIEEKYYKLWLSSTSVLKRILRNKIHTTERLEREIIEKTVQTYVQNKSFNDALSILGKHKFLILSGIPGIGKTTLAYILVYYFLSKDYEDLIPLDTNIGEAFENFHEGKAQIFLYDDFLGRTFLENKLSRNEDMLFFKFLNLINGSKNKLFILTTREYILKQAQTTYEVFNRPQFEIGKYILDLSSYTKLIKAQILYNHLFFSTIKHDHIQNLLKNENYLKIIDHPNYNPRIIETIIEKEEWKSIASDNFSNRFTQYLEKPFSVWQHAFENQINTQSQNLLLILLTCGAPILVKDLFDSIKEFHRSFGRKYPLPVSEIEFNQSLKELEGTFIKTVKDSKNKIAILFSNPSIIDFLTEYLKELTDMIEDLIIGSKFIEQIFGVFSVSTEKKKIVIPENCHKSISIKLMELSKIESCMIRLTNWVGGTQTWDYQNRTSPRLLRYLYNNLANSKKTEMLQKIGNHFDETFMVNVTSTEKSILIDLYCGIKEYSSLSANIVMAEILEQIDWLFDLRAFLKFKDTFPVAFAEISASPKFHPKINEIIELESNNVDDDQIESVIDDIEHITSELEIDSAQIISDLQHQLTNIREEIEESYAPEPLNAENVLASADVEKEIKSMFESLRLQ